MRLFFAAMLPEDARRAVAALVEKLAATGPDCKWVEPDNLHLTLAFLGETPQSRLPELTRMLKEAAAGQGAFTAAFDRLGAFSSLEHPKVLWLGAEQGARELERLARPLRAAFAPGQRPFQAHLTLGRLRSDRNLGRLRQALESIPVGRISCRVEAIALVRSRLSPKGPIYEHLRCQTLIC